MPELIANSIWKLIILDKYVNFEKLYVMLDLDYNLMTKQRISVTPSPLWRRILLVQSIWFFQKLSGCISIMSGFAESFISILTVEMNCLHMVNLLLVCFKQLLLPYQQSDTIKNLKNIILNSPTISTAVKMSYLSLFFCSFFLKPPLLLLHLVERDICQTLKMVLVSVLRQSAAIGILGVVKWIHATTVAGTMCAVSVMDLTELRTKETALQPSFNNDSNRKQQQLVAAACKAHDAVASGTCQLKCKATDSISEFPHFKQGFIWDNSSSSPQLPPSVLATKSTPPLTSPPLHLLNDQVIQSSLYTMHDYICVETPFNVDCFEIMSYDHPNQPFVKSIMKSLHEGFWPFDKGIWKDNHIEEIIINYSSKEVDFKAIHSLCDRLVAGLILF
jgi:hypothetical protein